MASPGPGQCPSGVFTDGGFPETGFHNLIGRQPKAPRPSREAPPQRSLFSSQLAPRIGLYTASLVSLTDVLIGWCASDCDAPTHIVTYPNKHGEYPPSPTWRASPTWRKQKAFPLPVEKEGNSLLFSEAADSPMLATWDVKQSSPSAAAIGCRAVTGTGQAGGHRHIRPWECESAHRTLGMRMRTSDPGVANASIESWEYECVQIIMLVLVVWRYTYWKKLKDYCSFDRENE